MARYDIAYRAMVIEHFHFILNWNQAFAMEIIQIHMFDYSAISHYAIWIEIDHSHVLVL